MEIGYNQKFASTWIMALLLADQRPSEKHSFVHYDNRQPITVDLGAWLGNFTEPNIILASLVQAIDYEQKDDLVFNSVHIPIFYGFFKEFSVPGSVIKGLLTEQDKFIYNQAKKMMTVGQELIEKKIDLTIYPLRK